MKKNFLALDIKIVRFVNDKDIITSSANGMFCKDAADNDFTLEGGWEE